MDIVLDTKPKQSTSTIKSYDLVEVLEGDLLLTYIQKSESYYKEMERLGLIKKTIKLNDVTIVEKRNETINSSNLNRNARADFILTEKDFVACINLAQCLIGRLPGVIQRGGIFYLARSINSPMQIMIDGMPVEPEFLNMIQPFDVESIELLKSISNTAIYGNLGYGGLILINTKRGKTVNYASVYTPGLIVTTPKGISTTRIFYVPKYDEDPNKNANDLRSLVYWNPNIITDKSGKATFEFYNTGESGVFRAVIEGADLNGNIGRKIFYYQVN